MRLRPLGLVLVVPLWSGPALAQSSGPDARQLTDPQSVMSISITGARPVPIEDLYYTRAVSGASWSPDGKTVAFTTDLAGRLNLWKAGTDGGWPMQLVQSDDRQVGATGHRTASGSCTSRTPAATNSGTCTRCRVTAARSSI